MMIPPSNTPATWTREEPADLPTAATPGEIAEQARGLGPRDVKSIVSAFDSEAYEMVSAFVWGRTTAALRKPLASLGMDFVGEMLGRPDLDQGADPQTLGDHEVLSLAEDLGIITTGEEMRLKHALELVSHFAATPPDETTATPMTRADALAVLRPCVASVLGSAAVEPPTAFIRFRRALETAGGGPEDEGTQGLAGAPYFVIRTALSVLLAQFKRAADEQLAHTVANAEALIPPVWPGLRDPERWQIGQTYAEIVGDGNRQAAAGLKKVLQAVDGFGYVPETLRASAFSSAAAGVVKAHFAYDNLHHEAPPMRALAGLGADIPWPAFGVCLTAALCVRLGNPWGRCADSLEPAEELLRGLRPEQWQYYLRQCLKGDKVVLDKVAQDELPRREWLGLVGEFGLEGMVPGDRLSAKLLTADEGKSEQVRRAACDLRRKGMEKA